MNYTAKQPRHNAGSYYHDLIRLVRYLQPKFIRPRKARRVYGVKYHILYVLRFRSYPDCVA